MTDQLVTLTNRHAVPAIYPFREDAAAGGLMSYGTNLRDAYRLVGGYTGRILSGDKPADLPVLQATKSGHQCPNREGARYLHPLPLLGRTDEVIEYTFCCGALCRLLARNRRATMSALSPLSGAKRN